MSANLMFFLIACSVAFSIWWFFFADCETIIKFLWTLKDVPVRCLHNLL